MSTDGDVKEEDGGGNDEDAEDKDWV